MAKTGVFTVIKLILMHSNSNSNLVNVSTLVMESAFKTGIQGNKTSRVYWVKLDTYIYQMYIIM